ncbi:MAG: ABC transporter ATP-binding protein [Clostridia bacterium]|nr:ABC transporter ATP-binding protein [Clostridia bacterium]
MLLDLQDVSRVFRREKTTVEAVKHVSLQIESGEFVSIIGRSGSGKSTLINLITGLLQPTSGRIFLDGEELTALPDAQATKLRNARIGYVPQGQSTISNLSVIDNVRLPFFLFPREGTPDAKAEELLTRLGIGQLADAMPRSLSGGEQRRVAIARALINTPSLVVADEPTGDLDSANTQAIIRLFREIADGGTAVLMVTHEVDTTAAGDRVYRMEDGRLTQER